MVQSVDGSQRRAFTRVLVEFSHAQASKISPLCARTAAGYLPSPDESRVVGVPKLKPVILF